MWSIFRFTADCSRGAAIALAAAGIAAFATSAHAGDDPTFADTVLGDWAGLRTRLRDAGANFTLGYEFESAANLTGGRRVSVRYTDQWTAITNLDLQKLVGIPAAALQFTVTDRNGRNLSSDAQLNTLQLVQEVFGRGQTWRITQLWYDQSYFDGVLNLKVGRLTLGEDFANFSCEFMNLTFCGSQPGNLVGNYWFNWPVSQWAGRVRVNFTGFGYAEVGAYEVNPNWLTRRYAFYFGDPPGATGALIPAGVGWLPSFGPDQLPGSYKFGAWYNTSKTADVADNTQGGLITLAGGTPLQRDGAYGAYVNFQQKLTKAPAEDPDHGISVFFNATVADRRTSFLTSQIALGVFDTGPFHARPTDQLGIAFGRTHVNDRVAAAEAAQNAASLGPVGVQHSEYVCEIYYKLHALPGIYIQPNIQYIHDPGGVAKNKDVVISGLKFSVRL